MRIDFYKFSHGDASYEAASVDGDFDLSDVQRMVSALESAYICGVRGDRIGVIRHSHPPGSACVGSCAEIPTVLPTDDVVRHSAKHPPGSLVAFASDEVHVFHDESVPPGAILFRQPND